MPRSNFIIFRGVEREVAWDVEGRIGDHEDPVTIMWWFPELSPDEHTALKITDAEDAAVDDELYQRYVDEAYDGDPF